MSGYVWPFTLVHGDITLRPMRWADRVAWTEILKRNELWLGPWAASNPDGGRRERNFMDEWLGGSRAARAGRNVPMVISHDGSMVGQITLGNIVWGSLRQGYIGYWIDERFAGRGITPTAVAMLTDFALGEAGLHRIEINIRPENHASLAVVSKLGFVHEGSRPRYLHIDGDWRDHEVFVMTSENLPSGGLLNHRPLHH